MEKDIEEYRQPWESNEHWELRKEFLLAHAGKYDENRLLCLAQAFANVELLGCAYPKDVDDADQRAGPKTYTSLDRRPRRRRKEN
uniref:XRN2-binding (XTBD) domain-containing protein n=1 Tax=Ixodes ricinus TaxID=34613 RepID=V5IEE8_IXORI